MTPRRDAAAAPLPRLADQAGEDWQFGRAVASVLGDAEQPCDEVHGSHTSPRAETMLPRLVTDPFTVQDATSRLLVGSLGVSVTPLCHPSPNVLGSRGPSDWKHGARKVVNEVQSPRQRDGASIPPGGNTDLAEGKDVETETILVPGDA